MPTKQLLIGSRVRQVPRETPSVSVAADERPVLFHPLDDPRLPVLRRGTRVGMVVAGAGTVDARSAVELPVQLDGAAVELPADGGREYVLAVQVPDGTHHYLEQAGRDPRVGSDLTTYEVPGPGDVRRLVVSSDEDTPATEVVSLRVRSILTTTDLVVGGPPVRFEVTDPGRWVTARVPATAYGRFTLTATDVTLPDGWWAEIPGPCWPRDCLVGPRVDSRTLVSTGSLEEGEHTIAFRPAPGTTGGVTLSLTATP